MDAKTDFNTDGYLDGAYGRGVYAPAAGEIARGDLKAEGQIPPELDGIFVQVIPSPAFAPGPGHSWFDGDGMIQSVELTGGKATFRARYVETEGLKADREAGFATYVGSLAMPGAGKRHKNVANTDLIWHAGRLIALWWEGGVPYEIALPDLETLGTYTYNDTLKTGMTSHAKLDPKTGQMYYISWGTRRPYLTVGVASDDGQIERSVPIELAGPRVQHDLGLSDRYVAVFDFPLAVQAEDSASAMGFRMSDAPSRIGLLSRDSSDDAVRWFDVEPCYMWHIMCAYDDGDDFVLLGVRSHMAVNVDQDGTHLNDRPLVDGEHRFDTYLHEWRLNVATGAVVERDVDNVLAELPRVNDAYICSGAHYGYAGLLDETAPTFRFKGIAKYNLRTFERQDVLFPKDTVCNEPNFVSAANPKAEDDGYVVAFVTDAQTETSQLWVIRADDFAAGAVAKIDLPQRVPAGFHGRWIPRAHYSGEAA